MVDPGSAVPVIVGVVTLVIESLEEAPESLAAVRTGADGADGARVSMRTSRVAVAETAPFTSSAENRRVWVASPLTETVVLEAYTVVVAPPSRVWLIESTPNPAWAVRVTTTGEELFQPLPFGTGEIFVADTDGRELSLITSTLGLFALSADQEPIRPVTT